MKMDDVLHLTPKFWQLHLDLIAPFDYSAYILSTIQFNLVAGTLAPFARDNADYKSLLDQVLRFDIS